MNDDIELVELLLKIRESKISASTKSAVIKYINKDYNKLFNILQGIRDIILSEEGVKDIPSAILAKYNTLKLNNILDQKYFAEVLRYKYTNVENKLNSLKVISDINKNCPYINLKTGIYLMILEGITSSLLYKDITFSKNIISIVKAIPEEQKNMSKII